MAGGWDFQRRGPRKWDGAGPGRLASAGRRGLRKAERKACARRGPAPAAAGGGARAARAGRIGVSAAALRGEAKMAASRWARKAVVLLWASDLLLLLLLLLPPPGSCAAEGSPGTPDESTPPPRKKKKDIRDYNDADMARLLEQWEQCEKQCFNERLCLRCVERRKMMKLKKEIFQNTRDPQHRSTSQR
uniref:LRP chaperone MESD n=1 Tax=Papio anubis TaxID=9555 RepID=A0A8I5NU62_PAPAN